MTLAKLAWTEYSPLDNESSLLDPLALDYFSQQLGNVILPSFTTRTGRARYYSMVTYGAYIADKFISKIDYSRRNREQAFYNAFMKYERYWLLSLIRYYSANHNALQERDGKELELRGKRGAIKADDNNVNDLDFPILTRQLELGAFGAYRSSMESLQLIKDDLTLTGKGRDLARSFCSKKFDELVITSLETNKPTLKLGNATMKKFGETTRLDAPITDTEEVQLLRSFVLDNPADVAAIGLIYKYRGNLDPLKIITSIAAESKYNSSPTVNKFSTILAFEELAIALNKIWCTILLLAGDNLGKITLRDAVAAVSEDLNSLQEDALIEVLQQQHYYSAIKNSYHGPAFARLLQHGVNMTEADYGNFIVDLIKYHQLVMQTRNSGVWSFMEGSTITALEGYDYARKNCFSRNDVKPNGNRLYLHSYKLNNILSLIMDTRWVPNE